MDVELLNYQFFFNRSFVALFANQLPVGVYMYGQLLASNHVDYIVSAYGPRPIFLDFTAPLAGLVYDGLLRKRQQNFTFLDRVVSANWADFQDPESGIRVYRKSNAYDIHK